MSVSFFFSDLKMQAEIIHIGKLFRVIWKRIFALHVCFDFFFFSIFQSLKWNVKWTKLIIFDTISFLQLIAVLRPQKLLVRFVLCLEKEQCIQSTARHWFSRFKTWENSPHGRITHRSNIWVQLRAIELTSSRKSTSNDQRIGGADWFWWILGGGDRLWAKTTKIKAPQWPPVRLLGIAQYMVTNRCLHVNMK